MAVERSGVADEDAETVTEQRTAARRIPSDQPGTEPPGLSRAAARAANEGTNSPGKEELHRSGWDAPGIADHPRRAGADSIRLTDDRRSHILDGEPGNRGGHRHGTGNLGKTEFPADWDDDTTVRHIMDVARRPTSVEMQGHGTWKVRGERDGVEVIAIVKPDGQIRTAFPLPGGEGVVHNPEE